MTSVLNESVGLDNDIGPLNSATATLQGGSYMFTMAGSSFAVKVTRGTVAWNNLQTVIVHASGVATNEATGAEFGYVVITFSGERTSP